MSILIFHSPMPIERPLDSGSAVRPKRMLEAFRAIGQEVLLVDGDSRRRRRLWREALGTPPEDLLGVYSELSTTPIALTDPYHLPRSPFMDAKAFRRLRERGVPAAAFYRDAYWRVGRTPVAWWKRTTLALFHRLEWHQLGRSIDHCFVPTLEMLDHLPSLAGVQASALPPGGVPRDRPPRRPLGHRPLRLIYVGGVQPPHYDLAPMFDSIDGIDGLELVICCRETEWRKAVAAYRVPSNTTIVHGSGDALDELYRSCDGALDWRPWSVYLSFASPIKTFEAIGWGLPLIANGRLPTGRLAETHAFGWGPETPEALRELLRRLVEDRTILERAAQGAIAAREFHTWEARARTVLETLRGIREAHR
jgi:hypothetical protein